MSLINLDQTKVAEKQISKIRQQIREYVDAEVQKYNFDDTASLGKYVGYPNKLQARAEALGAWVADVWDVAETALEEYKAGTRAMPADMSELNLPANP